MTSHAADSFNGDFRVAYVPARDFPPGATRPLYRSDGDYLMYPRNTDSERSPQYAPVEGAVHPPGVVGEIPQVPHTYALWEGLYGMMNEHGLAMGESTCAVVPAATGRGVTAGGDALFTVGSLMGVAMERCQTAVCAVQLMGDLAERYGFYGEDTSSDGGGESVTIADRAGDAWVFQVCGGVPNRTGAMWVAQRVPHGHIAVVANSMTIQEVDLADPERFRGSRHLLEDARAAGLWDGQGVFSWQRSVAPDMDIMWESAENWYDPLRMWRIFTLAAPSLGIAATNRLADMPFSVPAEQKVDHLSLMDWLRDTYQGTDFDLQLGALAGPWGSPRRFSEENGGSQVPGQITRAISVDWSLYTIVAQPGARRPLLWYAADSAKSSVFVPFFAEGLTPGGDGRFAVREYGSGSMLDGSFSLAKGTEQPAFWAFNLVSNLMQLNYRNISRQYVYPKIHELQRRLDARVQRAAEEADRAGSAKAAAKVLADRATELQRHVVREWWDLASTLIVRYNDQRYNFPPNAPKTSLDLGVPASFLESVGFDMLSVYPRWTQPAAEPPRLLYPDDLAVAKRAAKSYSARKQRCQGAKGLADGCADSLADFSKNLAELPGAHADQPGNTAGSLSSALFFAIATVSSAALGHALGYRRGAAAACADAAYLRIA